MSGLFGPKTTAAPAPSPTVATPAVQAASEAAIRRERAASGRASTMLTDTVGQAAPETATKKLLGQ